MAYPEYAQNFVLFIY